MSEVERLAPELEDIEMKLFVIAPVALVAKVKARQHLPAPVALAA